jgi:hypothetical protein
MESDKLLMSFRKKYYFWNITFIILYRRSAHSPPCETSPGRNSDVASHAAQTSQPNRSPRTIGR